MAAVAFLISSVYDPYIHDNVVATQSAFDAGLEEAAKVAEDKANISMVGGSTGDAHGTSKRIAAAIRSRIKQDSELR